MRPLFAPVLLLSRFDQAGLSSRERCLSLEGMISVTHLGDKKKLRHALVSET